MFLANWKDTEGRSDQLRGKRVYSQLLYHNANLLTSTDPADLVFSILTRIRAVVLEEAAKKYLHSSMIETFEELGCNIGLDEDFLGISMYNTDIRMSTIVLPADIQKVCFSNCKMQRTRLQLPANIRHLTIINHSSPQALPFNIPKGLEQFTAENTTLENEDLAKLPTGIKHIEIINSTISNIDLRQYSDLTSLTLKGNAHLKSISYLPQNLRRLEITHHPNLEHICRLPKQLESLQFGECPITLNKGDFPSSLCDIELVNAQVDSLPKVTSLSLRQQSNSAELLATVKNLEKLGVAYSPELDTIPSHILSGLSMLSLHQMPQLTLDISLLKDAPLKSLNVYNIRNFSNSANAQLPNSIEDISIHNTRGVNSVLTTLPHNTRKANISKTDLRHFPSSIGSQLEYLSLGANPALETISPELSSHLRELNVSFCYKLDADTRELVIGFLLDSEGHIAKPYA